MKTVVLRTDTKDEENYAVEEAAKILKSGGIVGLPTETVYGLACSGFDESAVKKVFEAKGRPQDNPLILHISDVSELSGICRQIPESAYRLAERFWPGPLTMILKKKECVPYAVSAGLETIAVRCPSHKIARAVIRQTGVPLAAPSANLSGKPSTTAAQHVFDDLNGKIPLIIDGGECEVGLESTIVDLTVCPPAVLRPGGISARQLSEVLGEVRCEGAAVSEQEIPKAPGMKYRHYAPDAPLTAVCGGAAAADYIKLKASADDGIICFERYKNMFDDKKYTAAFGSRYRVSEYAHYIFSALRDMDREKVSHIFVQCPNASGIGTAVLNRLKKSSGGDMISLPCPRIAGLTGNTGSGKSTAAEVFKNNGAFVVDCDKLYHKIADADYRMRLELCAEFGDEIYEDGIFNSRRLGGIVFGSEQKMIKLNNIVRKYILDAVEDEIDRAERNKEKVVLLDAPTLFETGAYLMCDITIAVLADNESIISRISERDGVPPEYARMRLASQNSREFFVKNADLVIENCKSKEEFVQDVQELYTKIENYEL